MSFLSNLFKRNSLSQQGQPQAPQMPQMQQQQAPVQQQQIQGAPSNSRPVVRQRLPSSSSSSSSTKLPVIKLDGQYVEAEGAAVPSVGANGVWINMILDESGSMQSVTDPTIENFNKYINEQKILQVKEQTVNSSILSAVQEVDEAATLSSSAVSPSPASPAPTPAGGPSAESESKEPAQTSAELSEKDECVVSLVKFDAPSIYSVYERTPLDEVPPLSRETYRPNGGTNLLDAIGAVIQRVDAHLNAQSDVALRPGVLVVIMTDGQENSSSHFTSPVIKRMISARQAAGWTFVFLGANIDAWSAAESVGIAQQNAFNFSVHKQENLSSALAESTSRYRGQMKMKKNMMMGKPRAVQECMNSKWNAKQSEQQFFEDSDRALFEEV